jgi:NAD(P)-dependent dehydrogenase (short-subunit alcohol dehydrogenase family)
MPQPLHDQVVVLTGASSGLGEQMARALSAAGGTVVLAARRLDRLEALAAELPDALVVECDVTCEEDRIRLIDRAVETYGRIDGLVNNAGVSNVVRAFEESVEDFDRVLQTNLVAPFSLAKHTARSMKERGGSIVNVASIAGLRATRLPAAAYTASKTGLVGLTRELATQWGRHGIRVNALAPGWFPTEMTEGLFGDGGDPEWISSATPLGRSGRSGELDTALVFLLDPASSFVTGQTIVVDGGLTAR